MAFATPSALRAELLRRASVTFTILGILALLLTPAAAPAQSDAPLLKREASRHMDAGRFGEAIALLDKYIAQRPNEADGYRLRGLCYEGRGQTENALQDYRKAVSLAPGNAQLQGLLARADKSLRERTAREIDGYKRELARNPNAAGPYLDIARSYRTLESWTDAEKAYDEYFKRTDGSADEVLRYCEILARLNQLQKGEAILQHYTEKFPLNADLQTRYGFFLLWLGKYDASRKAFETAQSLKPALPAAQDGLDQLRTAERNARTAESIARETRIQQNPERPVDRYLKLIRLNPRNEEARYSLVEELSKVGRFDEALRHLDTLALRNADSLRIQDVRLVVLMRRDSVYRVRINEETAALRDEPGDKTALLRIAGYYGDLGEYQNALDYLDRYLRGLPDTASGDVRFRYAQYAAWGKYFDRALGALDPLIKRSPGNLDYQLLRGQIAVWTLQDLDQGARYLNNVVRLSPGNIQAMASLSSALALQGNFSAASDYLERARKMDPLNRDVAAARQLLAEARDADRQRQLYTMLEAARELASAGDCQRAIRKYEEYLAQVPDPGKTVMLAYADVQSCAQNHQKAIQICDRLLEQGHDFDVALMRAKNVLWSGDSLAALQDFKQLVAEKPSDFTASLYLGESYQRLGRYTEAREQYQKLMERSSDPEEQNLVLARMKYLPLTGLSGAFASVPTRLAFSPPAAYYSDNQQFSLSSYGGRVELGLASFLSVGGFYARSQLQSATSSRLYNTAKGQVFLRFTDRLSASGSYGMLTTAGRRKLPVGDASIVYERPGSLSFGGYYERSDAAILLYTPYLLDIPYQAQLFKVRGYYVAPAHWRIQGSYKAIQISDGNSGSEFQFSLAQLFYDEVFAGYEYMYTDYLHQAAFIPFTNHTRHLYYAPQVLESHSLVVEWQAQKDQEVALNLEGKVGYLPSYRATSREIGGDLKYRPVGPLLLNGVFLLGSTYRDDFSYNYVSVSLSVYLSVL